MAPYVMLASLQSKVFIIHWNIRFYDGADDRTYLVNARHRWCNVTMPLCQLWRPFCHYDISHYWLSVMRNRRFSHWSRNKITDILQRAFLNVFFMISICLGGFCSRGPNCQTAALVEGIARCHVLSGFAAHSRSCLCHHAACKWCKTLILICLRWAKLLYKQQISRRNLKQCYSQDVGYWNRLTEFDWVTSFKRNRNL